YECRPRTVERPARPPALVALQLRVVEFDRGRPPEEADLDLHLPLVGVDLLDRPAEVGERPFGDLDDLTDAEGDLLPQRGLLDLGLQAEDLVDLLIAQGLRLAPRADELDDALEAVDDVLRPLVEQHLHQHVPRVEAASDGHSLPVADLDDLLGRDDNLLDLLLLRS